MSPLTRVNMILPIILTMLIGLSSYVGDILLYNLNSSILRAIADNLTHAVVGGVSWSLIIKLSKKSLTNNILGITLCFLISSLIDLDHFLLARSWKLRDARNLGGQRPILHCTIIPLFLWFILELNYKLSNQHNSKLCYYSFVIITAFLSHHIRDGTRRGLWFAFMGSTPPIPYYLYLSIAMGLPYFIHWLMPDDVINNATIFHAIQAI